MWIVDTVVKELRSGGSDYVCTNCGGCLSMQYFECPRCGSYDVRNADWLDRR